MHAFPNQRLGEAVPDISEHGANRLVPGPSGIGKSNGYYSFLAFTNERPVLRQRLKNGPFKHFYPPYTKRTQKLIDLLLK